MSDFTIRRAASVLHQGGVVAYPTEAVFGLGCDPRNEDAVLRLLAIKQRPVDKGLILIAASQSQLSDYIEPPDSAVQARLDASWPGPITWLLPARQDTPRWLRGQHADLAVRVTAHPLAAALCNAFGGAIVSTSANLSRRPPARSTLQVYLRCPGTDHVLHGKTGGRMRPSEIRRGRDGQRIRAG